MHKYDVAVIGGGPAGYVAAIKAAQSGKTVCLIEKGKMGGVCLNQGCIPTKTLLKSVGVFNTVKHSHQFGVMNGDNSNVTLDMIKIQERKNDIVQKLTGGVERLLMANGVKVFIGNATFIDKNTLKTEDEEIWAPNIIIATGSTPVKLSIPVGNDAPIINSEEALNLTEVPPKIIIIGGGYIGVEFAYIFSHFGAEVMVVELLDRLLPMADEEIANDVVRSLQELGVIINTGSKVIRIDGEKVFFEKNGNVEEAQGNLILMAVGRKPNTQDLNLDVVNVRTEKGVITVDARLRTNVPGIYAIGDVNGKLMLAHTASMEAIVAVENICGKDYKMNYGNIPQCIYLQPEVAQVGLTEKQAREKYGEIKIGRFPLALNGKALVEGEQKGMIKVIVKPKYNEIIGVHIYGIHATDMIAELVLAMGLEVTADEMTMVVHPHPSISEIIPEAFQSVLGRAVHLV